MKNLTCLSSLRVLMPLVGKPAHVSRVPRNLTIAIAGLLLCAPGAFAQVNSLLDLNGTSPGFGGPSGSADLTTTATWTTDTTGVAAPVVFPRANRIQIGNSASDFNGGVITLTMTGGAMTGGGVNIVSANVSVTMAGTANTYWTVPFTWTVPAGSKLTVTDTASNNGFNFNNQASTFAGDGLIIFQSALCANGNGAGGNTMNMLGGTMQLSQTKTSNFGNKSVAGGFTLTAGTLQFMSATALADAFSAFASTFTFTINGGAIDNLSGSAGILALGSGTYSFGGNFTFPGSKSLNLGANNVVLNNNVVVSNLANTLTLSGIISGPGGLTMTGPGTLAIGGASAYTGPTFVNGGTLALTNSGNLAASSAIGFGSNTTFDLSGMTGQLTNPNTLGLTNTTLLCTIPLNPTTNVVVGALSLGGASNTINIAWLPTMTSYPTTFHLINYSNTLNLTNFVLGSLPVSSGTPFAAHLDTSNAHLIDLVLTGGPAVARTLVWAGTDTADQGTEAWDVANSFNWINAQRAATTYNQLDFVQFDDTTSPGSPTPGQVQLTTTLTPTTMTVSNNSVTYTFTSAGGYLANPSAQTLLQLVKQGTGTLIMDNASANTYSGGTLIGAGGTVQVGHNNDGVGDLGAGPVVNNGTLIFDNGSGTFANVISGSGAILQHGSGTLNLSGANAAFNGAVTIAANSLLQAGSASAFGAASGITIESGGVFDLHGRSVGAIPVFAQGAGNNAGGGTQGAIDNSGAAVPGNLGLEFLTLTGDTTLSASGGRWDLRSPGGDIGVVGTNAATSTAALSTGGQPYNLALEAPHVLGIVSAWVDPQLANIDVMAGTLYYEGNTTGLGNPTNTLTVESGATLEFWNAANPLDKVIVVNSAATVVNGSGSNNISGPVILTNAGTSLFNIASGTTLNLLGPVSGPGLLQTLTAGTLILNGGNSFSGGIQGYNGTIIVNGDNSVMTGYNDIENGAFVVNGIVGGATFIASSGSLSGSGTNLGAVEVNGPFAPGRAGTAGTFTVGTPAAANSLTLDGGANVTFGLGPINTSGGSVNDLIVVNGDLNLNGGSFTINPFDGVLQVGVLSPYTLITYSGSLNVPSLPWVNSVNGYNFTLDTSVPGKINLVASGGPPVWNGGGGPSDTDWSQAGNWSGNAISGGNPFYFAGTTSLNNTNDTTADTQYGDIGFVSGAGPFVLNGNNILMGGQLINYSSNPQTVNLGLDFSSSVVLDGGSSAAAPLIIAGGLNDQGNDTTTYFNGYGILSDNITIPNGVGTGTNLIALTNSSANWTIVDNPTATPMALPWGIEIYAGTLNFGTATSAPNFAATPGMNTLPGPINHQVGTVSGAVGTLNMVNGTLTTAAVVNTAMAANSTGIINQTGGILNVFQWLQGANGANAGEVSIINVSGGTLNLLQSGNIYVASRGTGTLTVSGSAVVQCNVLDCSRNANGNTIGSVGTVNLDGGMLRVGRVDTANDSAQPGPATSGINPAASFYFNGGTLQATTNSPTFFQGSTVAPVIPIKTTVKAGGAIINDGGYAIGVLEPLQHDATLGATPDGGLTKLGGGTLTLGRANTFSGATAVSGGTLVVSGALAGGAVTVASGATLGGYGTIGGPVTVLSGGTLALGASIGTLSISNTLALNGTTVMKVSHVTTATSDVIQGLTTVTFGGTLTVTAAGTLQAGDTFQLFNATSKAGAFAAINLPAFGANLAWNTTGLTNGTLQVIAVTQPGFNSPVRLGNGSLQLTFSGTSNANYRVWASTNIALTPITSTWSNVSSGTFGGAPVTYTDTQATNYPGRFYTITIP
jgi:fibronectin-binding autotransporter adhesin